MQSRKKKNNRRRLVVEPRVQYSLIRQLVFHWIVYLAASVTFLTLLELLIGGVLNPWKYHVERLVPIVLTLVITLVVLVPAFVLNSLKLSNRFVGPIYRIRQHLRDVASGQAPQELKFRKADYWQELAIEIETTLEAVRQRATLEAKANQSDSVRTQVPPNVVSENEDTVQLADLVQTEPQ